MLTSQIKWRCIYGAAWKTKLIIRTVMGMKTDKINGRRFTSVESKWELSNGPKDLTIRMANINAGEMPDLIDDHSEQYIQP